MKSRSTAAILALFLGGFGVHKFYLGQAIFGILYLIFCWTFIPAIIAGIEFFILLLMSDHDFDRRFNGTGGESSKDKMQALAELKNLLDTGIITSTEYELKRSKMINAM
jgi:TM2 domain-containing membrane protein YozV